MKTESGYYRLKKGKTVAYVNEKNHQISAKGILNWIESLVVPPAWSDVWISKDKDAYMLATGYDNSGRKQYVYHPRWELVRESNKLVRMIRLGKSLPKIRKTLQADLSQSALTRTRVLAAVVSVLDQTGARIGNDEYTQENGSYGISTIRKKHVSGNDKKNFSYKGKSGKDQSIDITDSNVIKVIQECEETAGYELFKYVNEDKQKHDVHSDEVNEYIKLISGQSITAKDFRTWFGTTTALEKCIELGDCKEASKKAHLKSIFKCAAKALGNTPKIAETSYVHSSVIEAHITNTITVSPSRAKWQSSAEITLLEMLNLYKKSENP